MSAPKNKCNRELSRKKETIDSDFLVDSEFNKKRLDLCVAEGPREITRGEALPLDYWMDKTSHVSFNKGCFIGQEVTARVYHRNKIRRRLITINKQKIKLEPSKITDKSLRFINQIGEIVLLLAPVDLINKFEDSNNEPVIIWFNNYVKFNYYL